MKTVILNWNGGENDPFSEVNRSIAKIFHKCGKETHTLQITDPAWAEQLGQLAVEGVDFVFTWQGLGSNIVLADNGDSIWELLKIPLICVHGDHPAHMPQNHTFESKYCFHLYADAEFARYSNRHFRRKKSAHIIDIPQVFLEKQLDVEEEAVFHIVKNIHHTDVFEAEWARTLPDVALKAYLQAAEALKQLIKKEVYVDLHAVVDDLIVAESWDWFNEQQNSNLAHRFHSSMDYYLRSFKSMAMLDEIRDVPVNIYGRGWDKFKENCRNKWKFFQGQPMADSQKLYYSLYGIIDISPSKMLHDRSLRAMANGQPFLSNANLEDSFSNLKPYQDLFFDLRPGQLRTKCEAVMANPALHKELSKEFANLYHDTFHFQAFVNHLDLLALSVDRF
jgi:hypothetical protein